MMFDLDVPAEVVGVETVREPDGLALSSRNVRLSPAERMAALALPRDLTAGVRAGAQGRPAPEVLAAARTVLDGAGQGETLVHTLYLELTGPGLESVPVTGPAWLLGAVRVGATRLIDGMPLRLG